jgi:hypothetical protein
MTSAEQNLLKKYGKIFLVGWILVILIIGLTGFGIWFNDSKSANAQVGYWNKLRDQVGKETVIRQINEYNR